jgi:cytochrome c
MRSFYRAGLIAALAGLASGPVLSADKQDEELKKLAAASGCFTCHSIEPGKPGPEGLNPIGPPWTDVARKYKGDKHAVEQLTHTVMTGSNPYVSHWRGKVSGLAMPPNAVAIKEKDARKLVRWILTLDK